MSVCLVRIIAPVSRSHTRGLVASAHSNATYRKLNFGKGRVDGPSFYGKLIPLRAGFPRKTNAKTALVCVIKVAKFTTALTTS
jgi:hypothetical protein